jgi:hypothetical protein
MAYAEMAEYDGALQTFEKARGYDDNARRNADSWITYVQDRRRVALARP